MCEFSRTALETDRDTSCITDSLQQCGRQQQPAPVACLQWQVLFNSLEINSSTLHTPQHLQLQVRKVLSCLHIQGASGLGGVPGDDHPGESLSPVVMPCDVLKHESPPVERLTSLFYQGGKSLLPLAF